MRPFIYLEVVYFLGFLLARWALRPEVMKLVPPRIALLPLLTILLAKFSPTLGIYLALLFMIPFVVVRTRAEAAMTMLALLLPTPPLEIPLSIGSLGLISLTPSLSICTACILIGLSKPGGGPGSNSRGGYLFIPALLILTVVESRGNSFAFSVRNSFGHFLAVGLPSLIIAKFVTNEKDARRFLIAVIVVTTIIAALGVFEGLKNWPLYQTIFKRFMLHERLSATLNVRAGHLRAPGPYRTPTDFGFALTVSAMAVLSSRWAFKTQATFAALIGVFIMAVLNTQSRGALLGFFVGGVALAFYRRKVGVQMGLVAFAVAAGLGLAAVKASDGPLAERLGLSGHAATTADYRNQLLDQGWVEFKSAPIIGRPRSQVAIDLADLVQGEGIIDFVNTYLWIGVMTGSVGLAIFFAAVVKAFASLLPRPKDAKAMDVLGGYAFSALVAALTMLAFTSFYGIGRIWFVLILSFTVVASRLRSQSAKPARAGMRPARLAPPPGAPIEAGRA